MFSNTPKNICSFSGILTEYSVRAVGDGNYLLGKGILLLSTSSEIEGLKININVWGEVASRLEEVPLGSWISVVSYYSPSVFRNTLQDTFIVDAFYEHES